MNPDFQPYKYNWHGSCQRGQTSSLSMPSAAEAQPKVKELDKIHGLNTYDYGARQHDPILGRWDRIDPLCEKYYGVSPYVYCVNNPVCYVDPDGRDSTYYNSDGQKLYSVNNDPSSNVIFALKTTITKLDDISKEQGGWTNPISQDEYNLTEEKIREGNIQGDHMKNVTCFGSFDNIKSVKNSIKDNGQGGTLDANNREYSGDFTKNGVNNVKVGPVGDPSKIANLPSYGCPSWHSHPSGSRPVPNMKAHYAWQQSPSRQDIKSAKGSEFVYAMGNGKIYKYDSKGIYSILPLSIIK